MTANCAEISRRLRALADPRRAEEAARFFKTGPGQYGEGDQFLGLTVPMVRAVAKEYRDVPPARLLPLLRSAWHEERLCCLVIWVTQFDRAKSREQRQGLFNLYWRHRKNVNNWDLVDVSAPRLVGEFLRAEDDPAPLASLARAPNLWDRRIAILATWAWTKAGDVRLTLKTAEVLLRDDEDLIHKASGWMLREAMKVNEEATLNLLLTHASAMPRTMLRYAIERLDERRRKAIMAA
jgi:3-methyladenine DNA glycosylase AlkD